MASKKSPAPVKAMTFDRDLRDLAIIGSVPPGKRLNHFDGQLYVDADSFLSPALRSLRREGRDRTINTILNALLAAEERLSDMTNNRLLIQPPEAGRSDLCRRIESLASALQHCSIGITNLKATYAGDASAVAGLNLASQKADAIISKAGNLLTRAAERPNRAHEASKDIKH